MEKIKVAMDANWTPEKAQEAMKALRELPPWQLDPETLKWLAEDPELEDMNW